MTAIPAPGGRLQGFEEPLTRELLWFELRSIQENPDVGLSMVKGTLPERRQRWSVLRSFIRQARANDDAAQFMHGSAAALLHYYTALNLAKAALLIADPTQVVGERMGHGLSYNPTKSASVKSDFVTVQGGVFPKLYKLQTGRPLPTGARLPVGRLLNQLPENGERGCYSRSWWHANDAAIFHDAAVRHRGLVACSDLRREGVNG
jgi:YaaC-like Protein